MGLFGFGKKTPPKNTVRTPWGYVPLFTAEENLPRDLNQLRGMSYYYRNTEINDRNAFIIDRKICELDTEGVYAEARKRLGICYFQGKLVQKDVKKGAELFLFWVDRALEEGSYLGLRSAVVDYFNWGFTDCEHLLKVLNKRIEREHRENSDPLGLWTYRFLFPLWQYSYVKNYITLKGTHMPYFMEWLQTNINIDYSYWITKIYAREEGVYFAHDAAEAGNIFAIYDQLEMYRRHKTTQRIAELERQQRAIFEPLKKAAATHDHRQYAEEKARMDEKIRKCEAFFRGTGICIHEDYPFYKGEGSLYHTMSEALKAYRWLAGNPLAGERGDALIPEYNKRKDELIRYTNKMAEQNYLPGIFLQLLAAGSMLIYGVDVPDEKQMLEKYEMLVEKGYADAIRMKTECRPEEIPLARKLRCNPQVTAAYRQELEDNCRDAFLKNDWENAVSYLYFAKREGGMGRMAACRDRIVGEATAMARDYLKRREYQKCENIAWYAAELGEAYACHIMAVLYNNHKSDRYYLIQAEEYLKKAMNRRGSSLFDLDDEFMTMIESNLGSVAENIEKSRQGAVFSTQDY